MIDLSLSSIVFQLCGRHVGGRRRARVDKLYCVCGEDDGPPNVGLAFPSLRIQRKVRKRNLFFSDSFLAFLWLNGRHRHRLLTSSLFVSEARDVWVSDSGAPRPEGLKWMARVVLQCSVYDGCVRACFPNRKSVFVECLRVCLYRVPG